MIWQKYNPASILQASNLMTCEANLRDISENVAPIYGGVIGYVHSENFCSEINFKNKQTNLDFRSIKKKIDCRTPI